MHEVINKAESWNEVIEKYMVRLYLRFYGFSGRKETSITFIKILWHLKMVLFEEFMEIMNDTIELLSHRESLSNYERMQLEQNRGEYK